MDYVNTQKHYRYQIHSRVSPLRSVWQHKTVGHLSNGIHKASLLFPSLLCQTENTYCCILMITYPPQRQMYRLLGRIRFSETETSFSLVLTVSYLLLCETKTGFWNYLRTWFRRFHCWNVATPTCLLVCLGRWKLKNREKSAYIKVYVYGLVYFWNYID